MKKSIVNTLVLVCICAVMAVLLALTNAITAPIIKKNQDAAANAALLEVMPDGVGFEKITFDAAKLPKTVTEVYKEENGGYVITLKVNGYASDMIILCGVKADGTVSGVVCLSSNETLGYEKTYGASFVGKDAAGVSGVDTISGATKTTLAYKNAINDALNAAIILGGGSVDLRTEEEILNDNLSAALPAAEGKFEKLFLSESIEGIDAVYVATNGKGWVYVMGDQFVPVDEDGNTDNDVVRAAHELLTSVEEIDFDPATLPKSVIEVLKDKKGTFIITLKVEGFAPDMIIKCAVKADGTISSAVCISSNETNGAEKTYGDNFVGKDAAGVAEVDTVAKSTMTTTAYKNAINDALNAAIILGGGSVDIRTEEEIFNDNLSAALPAAEGKFEKPFLAEVLVGIDAVYAATNGKGWVYVIGEEFIPVDEDGNTENAVVSAAHAILVASTATDVDRTAYTGIHKNITSIKKTATGNYIFEVKGAGYGIQGGDDYHPASGKYIIIRVSMTADGKIIDTLTVSQEETKGLGDACADEKFYGQLDGKTEDDYKTIDGIAGATMTTDGYLKAIERAFAALNILEGGN